MSDLPERDLLAGTLALRLGFVTAEQLRLATSRGAERKPLPLEDILLEQQHVDLRTCRLLRELVDLHLELNQHDPQKCLLALQSQPDAREKSTNSLQGELDTSLENFSEDPNRTLPLPTAGGPDASKAAVGGQRFRLLRPHARGGLGEVSVAYDVELNREVALKQIQSQLALDAECRSRFLREARITGALEHPGIVPVYALGHYPDGRPYYAMRFIRGQSMKAAIDRLHQSDAASNVAASLEFRQLLNRFVDVCNAIEYAHSRGVLHRDLKPANIMLGKFGETLVVDWGLAKALPRDQPVLSAPGDEPSFAGTAGHEPAHTRAGSAVGTPVYMSPEQAAGSAELTAASDIYSLGATLYTLLTGRLPFAANPQDILRQVQRGEFRRPRDVKPDVPRALEAICCHAMSLIPTARYKSAGELAGDIERYLADEPVTIHREAVHERAGRWFRKHRAWALASVLSLAVIAGISTVAAAVVHQQKNRISDLAIAEAEAREWAERHLDVAQFTLHSLGEIALNIRDLPGAASSLQQSPLENAVFLYEQFLAEEPHTSRPEVLAKAHGNLGTLHVALSNDRAAEVSYRRSIATYENLLAAGGDARLRNELLLTYGNLAALLQRSLRPESWTMHNRIIDELRKLSLEQSHDLARERELARAHLNRGMHIQRLNELQRGGQDVSAHVPAPVDLQQSAIDDLREARQRFAALRESHPAQSEYLLEMAQSTNAYVTALAATAAPDPSASALANAARLLKAGSILRETRDLQQNAILQLEAAAKSGPDEIPLRASLAQALAVYGQLLFFSNDPAGAEQALVQAAEEAGRVALQLPTADSRAQHALMHYGLGGFFQSQREHAKAVEAFEAALVIQQPLVVAFPSRANYASAVAATLTNRGLSQLAIGDSLAAQLSLDQAIQLSQQVCQREPDNLTVHDQLRKIYAFAVQAMRANRDHRSLATLGEKHFELRRDDGRQAYEAAQLIALAIDLVAQDPQLAADQQTTTIDQYSRRAVELLQIALNAGYRPTTAVPNEPDFQALRQRADFQELSRQFSTP